MFKNQNCSDFPGVGLQIKGEVYTIDEKVLEHLGKIFLSLLTMTKLSLNTVRPPRYPGSLPYSLQ